MGDPKVGDRRPREGRCARCDRPLTDEFRSPPCTCGCGRASEWLAADSTDSHCRGDWTCSGPFVDWRARALAAEAALAEAEASGRQHGLLAGAMVVADLAACACGDHWTARNRHAPDCAEWMVDEVSALSRDTEGT